MDGGEERTKKPFFAELVAGGGERQTFKCLSTRLAKHMKLRKKWVRENKWKEMGSENCKRRVSLVSGGRTEEI